MASRPSAKRRSVAGCASATTQTSARGSCRSARVRGVRRSRSGARSRARGTRATCESHRQLQHRTVLLPLPARPAGPVRILFQQHRGKPGHAWREAGGRFQRIVYHPHGLATGDSVMTGLTHPPGEQIECDPLGNAAASAAAASTQLDACAEDSESDRRARLSEAVPKAPPVGVMIVSAQPGGKRYQSEPDHEEDQVPKGFQPWQRPVHRLTLSRRLQLGNRGPARRRGCGCGTPRRPATWDSSGRR